MKATWFGAGAFRLHYGEEIIVLDAERAQGAVAAEIASGAQRRIASGDRDVPLFDAARFVPPAPLRPLDADQAPIPVQVYRIAEAGLMLAAPDEPSLIVLSGTGAVAFGPWADGAVVILADAGARPLALAALASARLRLVALALGEDDAEAAVGALRPVLGRAGLIVLEQGMALEL